MRFICPSYEVVYYLPDAQSFRAVLSTRGGQTRNCVTTTLDLGLHTFLYVNLLPVEHGLYSTVAVRVTRNDKVECSIHSKGIPLYSVFLFFAGSQTYLL